MSSNISRRHKTQYLVHHTSEQNLEELESNKYLLQQQQQQQNTSDKGKLRAEERFSVTNNLQQGKRSVVFDPENIIVLNL